ncbi:MAG: hypothetical protein E6K76_10125 [Candidatus Eisenbacteria bacterium]|uniref:Uncharacterized protein n=1 Tax=Eiseniibacteriota bacterium TaxID=2212470 RepID=A0A538T1R2_UNCEI|nr:MAG: hypothetical protein E6K76_10125 [Candidatus Eisenbacteria bacterium]
MMNASVQPRRVPGRRATLRFLSSWGCASVLWTACILAPLPARAVVLDDENRIDVVLKDNTHVTLFGQAGPASGTKTENYYYLPTNLHLSKRPDSTPEFLFLKFTTEARAEQGGVNGGLMHFLMEWGLTPDQEAELKEKIKEDHPKAMVLGAVPLEAEGGEGGSFQIISGTLSDDKMASKLVTSGKAPLIPGGKCAAASRLSAEGAQLLASTFEKSRSITDLSIALNFGYTVLAPAARGTITFDWSKLETHSDSLGAEYKRKQTGVSTTGGGFWVFSWSSYKPEYSYSYDEMHKQYDFLVESQVVKIDFDELVSDERVAKVREAFFQYFLNAMTEPAPPSNPTQPTEQEKKNTPNIQIGEHYVYKKQSFQQAFAQKTKRINLSYRMAIKRPCQLVGNLASWYDGVRDNPKCVAAVNLNDPFFQHRDINFILDLDAKDMFEQEANYVTVNVRKNRSTGNPFQDHVTIDAKYLKEKGINASVTYARAEDKDADVYEYQAQWSFRGGTVWPANPAWQKGSWEGVTLAAPIAPRTLEVEGDLDALKASNITRITVQVHYPKFGTEMEENFSISPAKNEPLITKKIFMDRDAKGYAYRLVVDHRTDGKMATPWSAKVADDYIYAAIPKEMFEQPELKAVAKTAALDAATSAKEKVLTKFAELLGGKPQ